MAVPQDLPGKGAYYTRITLSPYNRGSAFELSNLTPNFIFNLPLPTELRDDTTVGYSPVNLETVGDILAGRNNTMTGAVTRSAGQLVSGALSSSSKGFGRMLDRGGAALGLLNSAQESVIGAVQSLLPPEQINSAIQQQNGVAPNPNPSVQFQGPVLRDFTLSWAFYPKNSGESDVIDKVIRKLKARALPSLDAGGGAILKYPHICQLNFFPWDEESTHPNGWTDKSIIKIKQCFMSGVNVNYNAFGTPSFFEGTKLPISYQLTISFKEIDYLLSSDWDSTAAGERVNANTAFNSATAIFGDGGPAKLVLNAGFGILTEFATVAGDFITGNYTTNGGEAAQNADVGTTAAAALIPGDSNSKVTISTSDTGFWSYLPGGVVGRGAGQWSYSRNAEGEYVLVFDQNDTTNFRTGLTTEYAPETVGTFKTNEELQAYLVSQEVYVNQIGTSAQPAAPAAAP
jgi:hypothetical protein